MVLPHTPRAGDEVMETTGKTDEELGALMMEAVRDNPACANLFAVAVAPNIRAGSSAQLAGGSRGPREPRAERRLQACRLRCRGKAAEAVSHPHR